MRLSKLVLGVVLLGMTLTGLLAMSGVARAQTPLGCAFAFLDIANNRSIYLCTQDDSDGLSITRLFGNVQNALVQFSNARNVTVFSLIFMEQDQLWLEGNGFTYTIDATGGPAVCENGVCVVGANAILSGGSFLDVRDADGGRFVLLAAGSGIGVRGDDATVDVNNTDITAQAFGIRLAGNGNHTINLNDVTIVSGLDGLRLEDGGTLTLTDVSISTSSNGIIVRGPGTITFGGTLTATGQYGDGTGLSAGDGTGSGASRITILADSTVTAPYGVLIYGGGTVTNNGTITSDDEFSLGIAVAIPGRLRGRPARFATTVPSA